MFPRSPMRCLLTLALCVMSVNLWPCASAAAGTWLTNRPMLTARQHHIATLLPDGKVLVAGGDQGGANGILANAELYNPATGSWTPTGPMIHARRDHTATLLPTGKVLVTGGGYDVNMQSFASAEVYDPVSGTWTDAGAMKYPRSAHTATLLRDGRVLVAGGSTGNVFLPSAELYDPATGTWSVIGNFMSEQRFFHTATLLPDGKVLAAGGGGASTSKGRTSTIRPSANGCRPERCRRPGVIKPPRGCRVGEC